MVRERGPATNNDAYLVVASGVARTDTAADVVLLIDPESAQVLRDTHPFTFARYTRFTLCNSPVLRACIDKDHPVD